MPAQNLPTIEQTVAKSYLEITDDIILALDRKATVIYINPKGAQHLGYDCEEIMGCNWIELCTPESKRDLFAENFQTLMEGRGSAQSHHEDEVRVKDGSHHFVAWNTILLYDRAGNITGILSSGMDTTGRQRLIGELLRTKNELQSMFDNMVDTYYQTDLEGKFIKISPSVVSLLGYTPEEMLGRKVTNYHADVPDAIEVRRDMAIHPKVIRNTEIAMRHKSGAIVWIETNVNPRFDHKRKFIGTEGVARDITQKKLSEVKLRQFAAVTENTSEGVMITDSHNRILAVNRAFCTITGYEETEVIGQNPSILASGKYDKAFYRSMWHAIDAQGVWNGELWNRRKDGTLFPSWLNVNTITDEAGRLVNYVGIFSDMSNIKESEQRLAHMALHDPLTDLANRYLLATQIEHAIDSARRTGDGLNILLLDLDNFKNINDSYGHDAGDAVLIETARRLNGKLRSEDILARFGGDEFVIVLEHIAVTAHVANIVSKLIALFREPYLVNGQRCFLSISVGIARFPDDGRDAPALIKAADTAMYRAKENGKNGYAFYDHSLTQRLMEQMQIENSLREAIDQEQLSIHYQPFFALSDGRLEGFEALVRWHHPTMGMVPPDHFIPVAEKSRLILRIGAWVLEQACIQTAKWHGAGIFSGRISVNISGVQLEEAGLLQTIRKALQISGLDPERLDIEVTETVMMANPQRWVETIAAIRAMGIHLFIDDFGTGYSSLSYLRQLSLDTIKIDKSFVDDLPENEDACAIVQSIIAMAGALGFATLAEGIETREQADYLSQQGCGSVQGYLFARPMDKEQTTQWLRKRSLSDPPQGR